MLRKIPLIWKKDSSKSCLELSSLQENWWAHMSITHWNGVTGLIRFIWLKYYNEQKWQIIFTLGLNAAKNNDYMEKSCSKSCLELNSLQKSLQVCMSISHQSGARELERLIWLKYYMYKTSKLHSIESWMVWKILLIWRKVSSKSCLKLNALQKSHGRICLSPTRVKLGALKNDMFKIL